MTMDRWLKRLAASAIIASPVAAQIDVDAFAPENAYLVVSTPSAGAIWEALERTSLMDLWREPSVQKWFADTTKEQLGSLKEEMEAIGVDIETIEPPTGRVGMAYFVVETIDEDGDAWPQQRIAASAEFGDGAEEVMDALWRVIEDWENDDVATVVQDEYKGGTIIELTWTPPVEPEEEGPFGLPSQPLTPVSGFSTGERAFIGRLGGLIVASDEEGMVERAFDAAQGADLASIADSADYQGAIAQHPAGQNARLIFLLNDRFHDLIVDSLEMMTMQYAMEGIDPARALEAIGLFGLRGVGLGVRVDADDAPVEITHSILAPQKQGLISLFDTAPTHFEPPSLVGADTSEVTRLSIDFAGILPLVRRVVDTFGEQERAMFGPRLDNMGAMIRPVLETMGPELYIITSYEQPYSLESEVVLLATKVADERVMNDGLNMAVLPLQLETREFEGAVIHGSVDGSFAIGSGYGYALMGPTKAVEDALRRAANPGGAALANEARFESATRDLADEMTAGSFIDMTGRMRLGEWVHENTLRLTEEAIASTDWPEELKAEQLASMREQIESMPAPPPADVILRYIRHVVTELHPTPDGFRGRALLLGPRDE
jgi:hypothetical protein